jgi:acyl-CoA synthetase (AMP-forming)/AMP-acid ligase II
VTAPPEGGASEGSPAEPTTVVEVLAATAAAHGDREALVDGDDRLTFAQLHRAAGGAATALAELGVGRGDVVCLSLPSSLDFAVAYHAAMRLGAITSAANPRLAPDELAAIGELSEPVATVSAEPGTGLGGRWVDPAALRAAWAGPATEADLPDGAADLPVAVVWTSGTTGRPKGALLDHRSLRAMAAAMDDLSRPFDRRLASVPFAHVGFMGRVWDTAANAICEVIVPTPWRAAEALRLVEAEGITVCQGVPTQWSLLLEELARQPVDTSSVRAVAVGAAPSTPTLIQALGAAFGCPVLVGYASTETGTISRTHLDDPPEVAETTVGRAATGVDLEIVDGQGAPVPTGEVGRVRCRSAGSMRGYWKDPDATAAAVGDGGWVVTGDLGTLDEAGNLTLVGREKDMYIRGGYNVYPGEVESALAAHADVATACVVAGPDPVLGEVGVAFVVPAAGGAPGQPDVDELRAWCRQRLADYKAPDVVELVAELPLNPVGKVDKKALAPRARELAAARAAQIRQRRGEPPAGVPQKEQP